MNNEIKQISWGIIRYLPGNSIPENDKCNFDGWYLERLDAWQIYNDWKRRFPNHFVSLVTSDIICFRL